MTTGVTSADAPEQRSTGSVLRDYGLPSKAPAEQLEALSRVAAALCGTPIAVVNLLDDSYQHQVGAVGFEGGRSGISASMCAVSLRRPELRYVPDASLEPAFADNPWVDGRLAEVRLYASAPMVLPDGRPLGTLCVFDAVPGVISEVQLAALADLADQAVALVEHAREAREARTQAHLFRLVAESPSDVMSRHRLDGTVLWISPSLQAALGRDPEQEVGRPGLGFLHPEDLSLLPRVFHRVGRSQQVTVRTRHADGSYRWMEVQLSPLVDEDGETQIHAVARDVSARVEAAEALLASNELLQAARDEALRHGELLSAVLETIDVGIVACDAEGRLTLFNRASRDFHGLSADASVGPADLPDHYSLYGADGTTPLAPEDVPLLRALAEGSVRAADMVIAPHGMPARLVSCDGRALRDSSGRLLGAVVAQKDETAARAVIDALRESEQRFRTAFSDGPVPMAHLGEDGCLTDVNAAFRRFLSWPTGWLLDRPLAELISPDDQGQLQRALAAGGTGSTPLEVRVLRSDGAAVWCELACSRAAGPEGTARLLVQLVDVHSRKLSERALQLAARRDPLTGAANREGLTDHLIGLLHRASPDASPVALLFVDLDHFKAVNDSAGHEAGDAVLRATAQRLSGAVRASDCVARLGGDEFVVVLTGEGTAAAEGLRLRLPALLSEPVLVAGEELRVGASVGLAYGSVGDRPADLLARADAAMYVDKRSRNEAADAPTGGVPPQGRRVDTRPQGG